MMALSWLSAGQHWDYTAIGSSVKVHVLPIVNGDYAVTVYAVTVQ